MEKNRSLILTLIIIITILIFIALLFLFIYLPKKSSSNQDFPSYSFSVWAQSSPSSDSNKNTCQLYEFPTSSEEISKDIYQAIPGNPTLNLNVLNNMTGSTNIPSCLDSDQILARQEVHTCSSPTGIGSNVIYACYGQDGKVYQPGETETFYNSSSCGKINSCPGMLALISVNFQVPSRKNIYCLTKETSGETGMIGVTTCNPGDTNQVFKVILTNPGLDPSSFTGPNQGINGILGKIMDRETGLCLSLSDKTGEGEYDPSSVDCSGSKKHYHGKLLSLTGCTGGPYPGFTWAFLPSLAYCTTGATCSKSKTKYTPQQVVFLGDLDYEKIPLSGKYKGQTGSSAIVNWLLDNNAQAIYFGGEKDVIALSPIGKDYTECKDKPLTIQLLDLRNYNTISSLQACVADGGFVNCYPFSNNIGFI